MIDTSIHLKNNQYVGFHMQGHAEYDVHGSDIVCAAVSALVLNTINSVEEFTEDRFEFDSDEKDGYILFRILEQPSDASQLLIKSLQLGLNDICDQYGNKYLKVAVREV